MKPMLCVQRQRSTGRRQRIDDNCFYSDAASETSSICSETSFRTGSEISDVRFAFIVTNWCLLKVFLKCALYCIFMVILFKCVACNLSDHYSMSVNNASFLKLYFP